MNFNLLQLTLLWKSLTFLVWFMFLAGSIHVPQYILQWRLTKLHWPISMIVWRFLEVTLLWFSSFSLSVLNVPSSRRPLKIHGKHKQGALLAKGKKQSRSSSLYSNKQGENCIIRILVLHANFQNSCIFH